MLEETEASPLVLVVDDVDLNRRLLAGLLEARGYRVALAGDGREALAAIAAERPDLVLLDLMMPELDGFGVLETLQKDAGGFLPVIVVSSNTDREDRHRALRSGAHDFLMKPVVPEELELRVRNVLALKRSYGELQRLNQALAAHNERVEELVELRTAELSVANERLLAADRYKDEFLTVVSHELRTPLTAIIGFTFLLERLLNDAPGDGAKFVKGVRGGADRLMHLVQMLMDFAAARAGKLPMQCSAVTLVDVVKGVQERLKAAAMAKAIAVAVEVADDVVVQADRQRLDQILGVLLDNAIKFSPDGGHVRIDAARQGDMVAVTVSDTGKGFTEEERKILFTPFRQADMSSSRQAGGTGLGLAFALTLVEAHGGTIHAESPGKGQGAVVRFTLPVG